MKTKLMYALTAVMLFLIPSVNFGQAPALGSTSGFALFTATGAFNCTGASVVTGNVGTNAGAFTAFPPGTLNGVEHVVDGVSGTAATDVATAYGDLSAVTCGIAHAVTLGNGETLTSNVYCLNGVSTLNGNLILDGQGNDKALFIIKINAAFSTNANSTVTLINSASLCNVYWQIDGAFQMGTSSVFMGTALVDGAITLLAGSSLYGRGLSTAGAISLSTNVVTYVPSAAGTITGSGTVCQGQTGVTYTVPSINNAVTYIWTVPAGATITSSDTTNSITVSFSASAVSGVITVQGSNNCGTGTVSPNFAVTLNPLPLAAGTITGTATVCQGQTGLSYTVPSVTNATTYIWTLPAGATVTAGVATNSITVSFSASAVSGTITVQGSNACGVGAVSANFAITLNPLPLAAGTITGTGTVCQGQTGITYTVPAVTNATSYIWTLPAGATITAGATTNTITVSFSASAASGNITVQGTNACGVGIVSAGFAVAVGNLSPSAAGTITGTATICQGQTGMTYTVPAVTNATSYTWALPAGATITSGTNTKSITVSFSASAASGSITVQGSNGCGNGIISPNFTVTVNPLPVASGVLTGTGTVCQGQTGITYTVPTITNATSYTWTLPAGATLTAGANTNSITVSFSSSAASGTVTVQGSNGCGTGAASPNFTVTVNPLPSPAGTITGTVQV